MLQPAPGQHGDRADGLTRAIDKTTVTRCGHCGSLTYSQAYANLSVPVDPSGSLHNCRTRSPHEAKQETPTR